MHFTTGSESPVFSDALTELTSPFGPTFATIVTEPAISEFARSPTL